MKSIKEVLKNNSESGRATLVTFISCGDPEISFTEKLVKAACKGGADIIELGVPFSDPMADGATIQAASQRALSAGTTLQKVLDMAGRLRKDGVENPFVLFSYYNPIFKLGLEKTAELSKKNGINAWLVVDVPLEESGEISGGLKEYGIGLIPLAAPTSGLDRVRATSVLPVAAGFGISNPNMAHLAAESADAVVVGSKLVDLTFEEFLENGESAALKAAEDFVASLAAAMKRS